MDHIAGVRCTICGRVMPYQEQMTCPHCGEKGILDILFDYDYIKKGFTKKSLAEMSIKTESDAEEKPTVTFGLDDASIDSVPAWISAVRNTKNSRN